MSSNDVVDRSIEPEGVLKRIWSVLRLITLEPVIFVYFLAISLESVLFSEIVLQKTCLLYLNFTSDVCNNFTANKNEEIKIEKVTNQFLMYCNLIQSIPAIFFVLFVGPWSDKHGRKIPLVLPFIGKFLNSGLMWIYTSYWSIPTEYVFLAVLPVAFLGGLSFLFMSMYSYISDVSTPETRTLRIIIIDMFLIFGPCIGLLLSNVTKTYLGFSGTYILTGILYFLCTIYIVLFIKETRGQNSINGEPELSYGGKGKVKDLFNCKNVAETFEATFEKRPNRGRAKIISLMAAICLMVFVFNSMSVEYLYTKLKFDWEYETFIYWIVASISVQSIGMAVIFPVLNRIFHVKDLILSIVGCFTLVITFVIQALASASYQMFIGSAIGLLGGLPLAIGRSTLSKIVPEESSGKLFSVVAALESILPLIAAPLYSLTYSSTISVLPGAFFIISAGFYFMAMLNFVFIHSVTLYDESGELLASEDEEE